MDSIAKFVAAYESDKTRKLTKAEQGAIVGALFAGESLGTVADRHGITRIRANLLLARAGGLAVAR